MMIGFIAWQTALGFWVVGYIMGFGSSIGLAAYLVYRARKKYEIVNPPVTDITRH